MVWGEGEATAGEGGEGGGVGEVHSGVQAHPWHIRFSCSHDSARMTCTMTS